MWRYTDDKYTSKESLESLKESLDAEQNKEELGKVLNNIGVGYYGAAFGYEKDDKKALDYYLRASKIDDWVSEINLGIFYHNEKDDDEAEKHLLKADRLQHRAAPYYLGELYFDQGKYDLAAEQFKRLDPYEPNTEDWFLAQYRLFQIYSEHMIDKDKADFYVKTYIKAYKSQNEIGGITSANYHKLLWYFLDSLGDRLQNRIMEIGKFFSEMLSTSGLPFRFDNYGALSQLDNIMQSAVNALSNVRVEISYEKKSHNTKRGIRPAELKRQLEGIIQKIKELLESLSERDLFLDRRPIREERWLLQLSERNLSTFDNYQDEIDFLCELLRYLNQTKDLMTDGRHIQRERLGDLIDKVYGLFGGLDKTMGIPPEIADLMSKIKHYYCSYILLGEYDCHRNTITIYIENVKNDLIVKNGDPVSLELRVLSVLAHETFHAFHFECIKASGVENWWEKKDYTREIMQESLARYAEILYYLKITYDKGLDFKDIKDKYINEMKKEPVSLWPYSGARYYLLNGRDNLDVFRKVFCFGLESYNKAKKLLDVCQYLDNGGYKFDRRIWR